MNDCQMQGIFRRSVPIMQSCHIDESEKVDDETTYTTAILTHVADGGITSRKRYMRVW
jgi:hypothetical protein